MNNCATCRWWKAPKPAHKKVVTQGLFYKAVEVVEERHGKCCWMPQVVEKDANDFCGQRKGRGETRYFDEDGLIISEEEAKKRYPEHFPQSDPYDGRKVRIDYLLGRGGPMWADEAKNREPSEAFFAALGEIFTHPTEEQRAKAERALKELLEGWRA